MDVTRAFYLHGPRDTGGALIVDGYATGARFIRHHGFAKLPRHEPVIRQSHSDDLMSRSGR